MLYGLLSGVIGGLDTVLFGIALSMTPFISTVEAIFLAPFVSAFLHDAFSSIWMFIYMSLKKQFKSALRAANTSSGRCIIIASIFAGPIGMTANLLSMTYIGPTYTAIISSLYPAIGAFLSYVFLGEKMKPLAIVGLIISILGIIILGYSSNGEFNNFPLGFTWAMIAVLGWASEAVICSYGMRGNEITPEESLQIRQLTSALVSGFIIIPILHGIKLTGEILSTSAGRLIILIAFLGTLGCLLYYKSIYKIGATKAMSLNITYSAWSILFGVIMLGNSFGIKSIICCSFIIVGSIMATSE